MSRTNQRIDCQEESQLQTSTCTDTGTIVGSFYASSQHGWNWKYLVLLDQSSYSRQFCIADTAWESDLEGWQQKQCH